MLSIHNSGLGLFSSRISINGGLNIRTKNRKTVKFDFLRIYQT